MHHDVSILGCHEASQTPLRTCDSGSMGVSDKPTVSPMLPPFCCASLCDCVDVVVGLLSFATSFLFDRGTIQVVSVRDVHGWLASVWKRTVSGGRGSVVLFLESGASSGGCGDNLGYCVCHVFSHVTTM